MSQPQILVVGDAMLDRYIHYRTVRQSPEGGHPVVQQHRIEYRDGGAGAVAAMCEALGARVTLVGSVANARRPVKTRHVVDGRIIFRVDEETILADDDAVRDATVWEAISCAVAPPVWLPDVVLIADYGKGIVSPKVMRYIDELFNPSQWSKPSYKRMSPIIVDPAKHRDADFYRGAWAVCPNHEENQRVHYWDAFDRVVLKLGGGGIAVKDGHQVDAIPSSISPSQVVDVCGAGDQLLATLGVLLAQGYSFLEAADTANLAAGLKCTKFAATPVTRDELRAAVEKAVAVEGQELPELSLTQGQ